MYCSRCGAQVNDNSNFCCHCGSKLNSKSEIYNNQEMDEEDITNKLTYIVTFLSDICISHFNMSKKNIPVKEEYRIFVFLRTVLECTDKHCNSTTKVTRKVIEEYASNVDCILTELFQNIQRYVILSKYKNYRRAWDKIYLILDCQIQVI